MGCELSVPDNEPISLGKTERRKRNSRTVYELSGSSVASKHKRGNNGRVVASHSSTVSLAADEVTDELPKLDHNGHLMPEEVARRTSSSLNITKIAIGNKSKGGQELQLSYGFQSMRGYYPNDLKKSNQDKLGITLNFSGEEGDAMFAVYDGHGQHGHCAASFSEKKLPKILAKHVRKKRVKKYISQLRAERKPTRGAWNQNMWPFLETSEIEQCCHQAFIETNKLMHFEKSFSDMLCGTTAATVIFHAGKMTVCNVGDSRVLLGHRMASAKQAEQSEEVEKLKLELSKKSGGARLEGEILAIPLTKDQTPYRRDERERVSQCGAEIRSMDGKQHDDWGDFVPGDTIDEEGDPPRIFAKGKEYPGTAFTRSLGDKLAEGVGVIAVPEIITKILTQNDEFLVIASDGIFEFLTNKYVMNVCATSATPLEACKRLTRAAYDQWLIHENRTDDITVIVCFLSCSYRPTVDDEPHTTESLVEGAVNF